MCYNCDDIVAVSTHTRAHTRVHTQIHTHTHTHTRTYTHTHTHTYTHIHRSLDVNAPLYLGGLEGHMSGLPLSGSSYRGCLAGVTLDGTPLDLASPLRSYGTVQGCPPLDATCSSDTCGVGLECREVWNGTLCSCGDTCQNSEDDSRDSS